MAEKQSMLIKYKYLEYVNNANLSDADSWVFIKSLIEYDKTGKIPEYKNPILIGLFAVIKSDLDSNKEKWEEISKTKSEAGKKGGAPKGNNNASKQAKQADGCYDRKNKQNKQKQHDSGSDLVSVSDHEFNLEINLKSSGGYIPPLIKKIKKETAELGFFIDTAVTKAFIKAHNDHQWLTGQHSFIAYCAEIVRKKYPDKDGEELKLLFISAIKEWEDLRESYPNWKEKKERKKARENPPEICSKCHANLEKSADDMYCKNCQCHIIYDEKNNIWVYEE